MRISLIVPVMVFLVF
uniref:Uncharacterized protein n=1 Tax=Rhizophora mucronata TaxID=61149 RepID=A0A2P2N6B9_RHIMU